MSKINNGGPAFPMAKVTVLAEDGTPNEACSLTHDGMTLRDYFAAHCPITIEQAVVIANDLDLPTDVVRSFDGLMRWYAELRVRYADAMLAAREVTK